MPGSQTPSAADTIQVADRHHRDQPQLAERPLRGLTAQLGAQRFLGALPLRLHLRALEIHARAVAIERFLQRRDDDAGEPRFELAERAARGKRAALRLDRPPHASRSCARPLSVSSTRIHCANPIRELRLESCRLRRRKPGRRVELGAGSWSAWPSARGSRRRRR